MKKIMFSDKYGLTDAVLKGVKTMTRRLIPLEETEGGVVPVSFWNGKWCGAHGKALKRQPYEIGEIIAIAQSYETLANSGTKTLDSMLKNSLTFKEEYCGAGWGNKMFVKAELMPHKIKITNVSVERLQSISDEDAKKEGIYYDEPFPELADPNVWAFSVIGKKHKNTWWSPAPKIAFENLIKHMMGKEIWERNPWVFVYEFELLQ